MELVLHLVLYLMLPSIAASIVVMLVANRYFPEKLKSCAAPLSVAAGLVAGNALTTPLPLVPDGFGWPALLAVLLGTLAIAPLAPRGINSPMRMGVLLFFLALLVCFLLPNGLRSPMWIAGVVGLTWLTTLVLDRVLQHQTSWILPAAWAVVVCGGAAALVMVAHSARFAQVAVLLATSLVGAGILTGRFPQTRRLLAPFMAISMIGLMVAGFDSTFSEVPWYSFLLIALAPLALAVLLSPQADRWPRAAQLTVPWLLMLVPVAVAIATAIAAEGLGSDY